MSPPSEPKTRRGLTKRKKRPGLLRKALAITGIGTKLKAPYRPGFSGFDFFSVIARCNKASAAAPANTVDAFHNPSCMVILRGLVGLDIIAALLAAVLEPVGLKHCRAVGVLNVAVASRKSDQFAAGSGDYKIGIAAPQA